MFRKLEEIRSSDKATKIRWLIILSAISLVLVVGVWAMSLRTIIANVNNQPFTAATVDSGPGFFATVKDTFAELKRRTGIALNTVKGIIKGKEIQLTPSTSTE